MHDSRFFVRVYAAGLEGWLIYEKHAAVGDIVFYARGTEQRHIDTHTHTYGEPEMGWGFGLVNIDSDASILCDALA